MSKKVLIFALISVLVIAATLSAYLSGIFERPEDLVYDAKAKLFRSEKVPPKDIKVILVDDASITALENAAGRWPWPRAIWSELLEFLSLGGAKMVLFDILFTERQDEANDRTLVEATGSAGNVIHSMLVQRVKPDQEEKYNVQLDRGMPADFKARFAVKNVQGDVRIPAEERNNDYLLPIDALRGAAQSVAVVEFPPDIDNVLRRTRPLREYHGAYYPVLGLAPFIDASTPVVINPRSIRIGDRVLPTDRNGNFLINMYAIDKADPISIGGIFSSLQKIRQGEVEDLIVSPDEFKDSIVFVGVSAVGGADLKATPLATRTPGVIMHVSLAGNYLLNDFLRPPDRRVTMATAVLSVLFTSGFIFFSKRFFMRATLPAALLIAFVAYSFYAFKANMIIETVPFVFATVASGFLSFGYLTFTEAVEKRRVSQLFTQYVSKDVLNEVLHNYKEYLKTSAGSKVDITVLFSDIRGFTTFSENTPPERVVEMLNTHFSRMAEIILKHDGTLDKYIGDAIMAFWGAPVPDKDHAAKAVRASMEMLEALKDVNAMLQQKGYEGFTLRIGIGLNTGVATIGNIGSEKKLNYTVVGDTVNLASRLESMTKEYGSALLLSEYTYEKVKDEIPCNLLGSVKVKGREKPVIIYTPEDTPAPEGAQRGEAG